MKTFEEMDWDDPFKEDEKTPKKEILEILGRNHTTPCVFDDWSIVQALYTYRGDVYCLNNGEDFCFDDLKNKQKIKISEMIKTKKFVKNKSFQ